MRNDQVEVKISHFFSRYIHDTDFDDATDLITSGLVNSLLAMQLVLYLEEEYKIVVNNDDLDTRNFDSIKNIADFIMRKTT